LRELEVQRVKGEVRAFDRVVIETTGLADPAPVIQALMTVPVVRRFRLRELGFEARDLGFYLGFVWERHESVSSQQSAVSRLSHTADC